MYDSHRHGYLTLGWIATIVGVLVFFAVLESKYSTAQKSAEYAYKCAEQNQRKTSPSPDVATTPGNVEEADSAEENQSDPNWCDLAAQQSMAESTYAMNIAAWATVIFTGVGAFLIWRTLLATQDAVFETRRIGEAQTRAYVHVESAKMFWGNENAAAPRISLRVVNTGQTPARWFEVGGKISTISLSEDGAVTLDRGFLDEPREWLRFHRWTSLGPGETGLTVGFGSADEVGLLSHIYPERLNIAVVVRGVVRYETFFNEVFESEFCFVRKAPSQYVGEIVREESAKRPTGQGIATNIVRTIDEKPVQMQRSALRLNAYKEVK